MFTQGLVVKTTAKDVDGTTSTSGVEGQIFDWAFGGWEWVEEIAPPEAEDEETASAVGTDG